MAARRSSAPRTRIVIEMTQKGGAPKSRSADNKRKALPPGRRVSKTGRVYTERRANRSDTAAERAAYDRNAAWRKKAATLKKSSKKTTSKKRKRK